MRFLTLHLVSFCPEGLTGFLVKYIGIPAQDQRIRRAGALLPKVKIHMCLPNGTKKP